MSTEPRTPLTWRPEPGHERLGYGLAALLGTMFLATLIVAVMSISGGGSDSDASEAAVPKGPGFTTVKKGDSYGAIASKAGITVDELIELNPRVNPSTLQPGQELRLRADAKRSEKKVRKGPMFHTVRTGQTLDLISRKTGKTVLYLKELNKGLKPEALQPGDRIRLRKK